MERVNICCVVRLFRQHVIERPLLLTFDGHLVHISTAVIEKAICEGIHIKKLPPHVIDILQPLDVTCFSPLKEYWEKSFNDLSVVFELAKQCLRRACLLTCFVRFGIKD